VSCQDLARGNDAVVYRGLIDQAFHSINQTVSAISHRRVFVQYRGARLRSSPYMPSMIFRALGVTLGHGKGSLIPARTCGSA
jgi:hypothetical protein